MTGGWRYRVGSVLGVVSITLLAVWLANAGTLQAAFRLAPVIGHLPFDVAEGTEFLFEAATTAVVMLVALAPLYKPQPRRILDIAELAARRVLLGCIALAAIGYFDYTYRLPRATLVVAGSLLLVALPLWFVTIRRRPRDGGGRTLIVGDDPETMDDILDALVAGVVGYVSPPSAYFGETHEPHPTVPATADGGRPETLDELACLGGLSRLEEVLVEYDVDTVVLAFTQPDRAEFFGALDACYDHGVTAKVHRKHADSVLTTGFGDGELVDVYLEPWDLQDHLIKRAIDLCFSVLALLALSPVIAAIVLAIKIEGEGPLFFSQTRTYLFGETFRVHKFRTLKPDPEGEVGTTFDGDRETPLGNFLRATHLDEIPQLWSILVGDMSVVGPRPAQTELEDDFQAEAPEWKQRWFVKPGLTGLAQINDATSQEPAEKLNYDIHYIRNQSVWFDMKITIRQFWKVFIDIADLRNEK
jgi:lipopolysaccharide/colanic/teichoic acid biosynthesis glycosyltransferase